MRLKIRIVSILLLLCFIISMMLPAVSAATGTLGRNTASRHITCTSLSSQAQAYYTAGTYDYATISAMHGVYSTDSWTVTQNNPVYTNLQQLMVNTHTNTSVVYSGTNSGSLAYYWDYTDTVNGGSNYLLFYCDKLMSQVQNTEHYSRTGMEREHVWCKSKADYVEDSNSGGADLHHLRPSYGYINGIKSNRSFGNVTNGTACTLDGVSVFTYASNTETGVMEVNDNIKGDIARILLYVYVRWGQPNLYTSYGSNISQKLKTAGVNTSGTINGSDDGTKIIDDLATLLEWMEIDPVDTWEMQRNDQIENVQGNRNVFIDYPEYAWIMFGMADQMPTGMDTPSGMAKQGASAVSYRITNVNVNNNSFGSADITDSKTVTVTPAANYYLQSATATSGKVAINGNTITVSNMTADTTVNVIFAKLPQYTVSYSVSGTVSSSVTCNQGDSITLPSTAANVEGYTFIGWTTASVAPENTTMPTVLTGSYTPNSNITLYAVYSHTEQGQGAESTSYQLISDPVDVTSGNYVITWNDTLFFPSETTSTKNPSAGTGIAVSNNQLTNTVTNEMIWTFTGDNTDGFVISHTFGDNTYYIYATDTPQGITVKVKNADETPNHWKVTTDATYGMLLQGISDVYRYLAVFKDIANANSWRFYNTGSNYKGTLRLYKEIAGFTPATYYTTNPICTHPSTHLENAAAATCTAAGYTGDTHCDDCGETVSTGSVIPAVGHTAVTDPAVASTCTIAGKTEGSHCSVCGTVITAQQTLPALGHSYNSAMTTAATCTEDGVMTYTCALCNDAYTEAIPAIGHSYNANGICVNCSDKLISIVSASLRLDEDIDVIYAASFPEGATASMAFTMNGKTVTVADDGSHSFTFEGVTPQCMGDTIRATLSVTLDGTTYTCTKDSYSVRQYCLSKLADVTVKGAMRTLISDVLAYGAAAQTYADYKANALVTNNAAGTAYSTFTSLSGFAPSFDGTAAEDVYWTAAGLTLTNSVAMYFRFYAESVNGLTVNVTINGRTQTFTAFAAVDDNLYEISFTGIKATEFADSVSASFSRSNARVGNTASYSVNTYICAKQADGNTALANLVKALYNYGTSAAAYTE